VRSTAIAKAAATQAAWAILLQRQPARRLGAAQHRHVEAARTIPRGKTQAKSARVE